MTDTLLKLCKDFASSYAFLWNWTKIRKERKANFTKINKYTGVLNIWLCFYKMSAFSKIFYSLSVFPTLFCLHVVYSVRFHVLSQLSKDTLRREINLVWSWSRWTFPNNHRNGVYCIKLRLHQQPQSRLQRATYLVKSVLFWCHVLCFPSPSYSSSCPQK